MISEIDNNFDILFKKVIKDSFEYDISKIKDQEIEAMTSDKKPIIGCFGINNKRQVFNYVNNNWVFVF